MNPRPSLLVSRHLVLAVFALSFLLPFGSIIAEALTNTDPTSSQPTLENFALAWEQGQFSSLILSSLVVEVLVVPSTMVLATLAAYGLATLTPPGHRWITGAFVIGLTLPTELVVIALYFNLGSLGLTNNYVGVALAEIAIFLPFGVFWMHTYFKSVPQELIESGRLDGASDLQVLVRLLLPISAPALTTLAVLVFMWAWNAFLVILVLVQSPSKRTATAGLGFFVGEFSTNVPLLAAASLIVIVPVVIVYLIFQRSFVEGITQGAIKG